MKRILALVLVAAMMMTVVAFADTAAPVEADTSISIVGLDVGDTVNLYQIVSWVADEGWKIKPNFADLVDSTKDNYSANVAKIVDKTNTDDVSLTKEDLEKITNLAKKSGVNPEVSEPTTASNNYSADVALGMYLALIQPKNADTIYNPMVVSADYTAGGSNSVDSSDTMGTSTVVKKDTVDLSKTVEDYTLDAGEKVKFEIKTTIPAFAESYVNPWFKVTDTMVAGTALYVDATNNPFTIEAGNVTYKYGDDGSAAAPKTGDTSFTISFDTDKIAALQTPQAVTITYYAYITDTSLLENVTEKTNDVEVKFPNNPNDDNGHGHKKDEVKVYTFTIDGKLFGRSDYRNTELIKVGVDKDNNPIESEIEVDNGTTHAALDGAVFGLYTDSACSTEYTNSAFNGEVTTANGGLMEIKGLDEGTYYLKEISAPAGYIKDTATHTVTIKAYKKTVTMEDVDVGDGCKVSYDVEVLDYYTVTVDGSTSTYEMTLNGPSISSVEPGDSSSEIKNTKGLELPSTGGIGTTLFYAIGGLMVLAAGIVLVSRRKADEE